MSIFNDKTLKGVADAVSKVLAQESEATHPKTDKEKKLASLAHPKDKITHKDVLVGRGVLKKEEVEEEQIEEASKYAKMFDKMYNKKMKQKEAEKTSKKPEDMKKKVVKEEVELDEAFPTVADAKKRMDAPKPSGGAGMKLGTRYGGGKQAPDVEDNDDDDKKPARGKYGARQNYKRSVKESFSEMISAYNEGGLKSLSQHLVIEEPDNEQFTKELEDQKASMEGKKKQPSVAAPSTQGVKTMPEEIELNADEINGVAIETISEELTLEDFSVEELEEFMMSEEYEQLDEVSKATLASYVKKASHDVATKGAITRQLSNDSRAAREKGDHVGARKDSERADKTFAKSWHRRMNMAKAVDRLAKEEVELEETEQLDEISKSAAASYLDKAYKDRQSKLNTNTVSKQTSSKYKRDIDNREKGMDRAVKTLRKEEVELEERSLTPGEKKEMEKNVKGMKKKLSGFKDRYGDRAKEVMYATATKMAKKD